MRVLLCSWMIGVCVLMMGLGPTAAQTPAAQSAPAEPKKSEPPPPPPPRAEPNPTVAYALALLVVALIMLLVCMPARRE
jgi:hypothetical protein